MEDTWEGRHALLSYTALVATQAQPLVSLATHLYVDTLWSEDDSRLAALDCQYTMCSCWWHVDYCGCEVAMWTQNRVMVHECTHSSCMNSSNLSSLGVLLNTQLCLPHLHG